MGGTVDPIHHGHLVAASEVAAEFDLDEVVFVPTGQPWQKSDKEVSPAEHRYLMTVVATASNPRFSVSRVDIDRPGQTYTADTLDDIRKLRPDADLFFITGADAMEQIMTWKNVEQLWGKAHFVGVSRPGHQLTDFGLADEVSLMQIPAMAISSTDCRKRVAAGKPVWHLAPDGVVQYIGKYALYIEPNSTSNRQVTEPWVLVSLIIGPVEADEYCLSFPPRATATTRTRRTSPAARRRIPALG